MNKQNQRNKKLHVYVDVCILEKTSTTLEFRKMNSNHSSPTDHSVLRNTQFLLFVVCETRIFSKIVSIE